MMPNSYFISDTHFGHSNILTFKDDMGNPVRSFSSVEEMDEHMVTQWNSVVKPQDRVYHLGDVVINKKYLPIVDRLNGRKVLIMGNHDIFGAHEYLKHFEDVRAYKIYPQYGIVCSHIPLYSEVFNRWKLNVHGHLHSNVVHDYKGEEEDFIDKRYFSVCVEKTNYTPISLDEILSKMLG